MNAGFRASLATLALSLAASPTLGAEALTCTQFRPRLLQAAQALNAQVAAPDTFHLRYDGETSKQYEWAGVISLSGTMTCGKDDTFEDFSIAIDEAARMSDELPAALARFTDLAAASICALAEGAPGACRALAGRMASDSLAQFKGALGKGDAVPAGSRDFFIVDGVDAELDMTPVAIAWSIGPGVARTTPATKQPLKPSNADQ